MSYTAFVCGFATAVVVIVGTVVVGAVKGKQLLKGKLESMDNARKEDKKSIQNAANLDPIKVTSYVKIRAGGSHSHATPVACKMVIMGSSLSFHKITQTEDDKETEKLLCRISTGQIRCSVLKAIGSSKSDPINGDCLFMQSEESIFTTEEGGLNTNQVMVKVSTVRELERWANIFQANDTTKEWRSYVKSLPQLDVFNLFISRIFFENRNTAALNELIGKKIAKKLKKIKLPKVVAGGLTVDYVNAGDEIPLVSNVSFVSCSTSGEMGFDFDLHYRGGFQLRLLAGVSVKGVSVPPILLSVAIEELRGRVHMSIGPPPSDKMWIGFHDTPAVTIDFKQEVKGDGGLLSAFVSLIPDLSDVVSHIVKVQLFEDMVLPNMDDIPLPNVQDTPPSSPEEESLSVPTTEEKPLAHAPLEKKPEADAVPPTKQEVPPAESTENELIESAAPATTETVDGSARVVEPPAQTQLSAGGVATSPTPATPPTTAVSPSPTEQVAPADPAPIPSHRIQPQWQQQPQW